MELRQLKYFKAACELQNFSEAARALFISQSTLSQQIKQLEDELDVLLFDRIGKRVVPTEAGLAFLPYAAKALYDAEDGKQIIRDLKGIETGVLHIGVTYSMSPLLITALGMFTKTYPKVKVDVCFATSEELLERLEANHLDFVLSFKPEGTSEGFETLSLFSSRLRFVVHRSHPLAGLSSITLKRLAETPLVLPGKGFVTRKKVDELCRTYRLDLTVGVEMNDVHTIIHTLRAGYWATILTQAAVRGEEDLVQIPILCADKLTSEGCLFWAQGNYRKKSALAFVGFLQKAVGNGGE
ncbi:LysR substrate-binding domain-containing protein [uncultured Bacteroides sp.]|uniref:LysR substrate-binding domain-containing protein n=1 Tax=uncultured Bacteroides sp. TaxID=162156 RepID=UPI00280B8561|nr:LysR substrate-binding domain-containing protein [uncultured Bacteroides sp.]